MFWRYLIMSGVFRHHGNFSEKIRTPPTVPRQRAILAHIGGTIYTQNDPRGHAIEFVLTRINTLIRTMPCTSAALGMGTSAPALFILCARARSIYKARRWPPLSYHWAAWIASGRTASDQRKKKRQPRAVSFLLSRFLPLTLERAPPDPPLSPVSVSRRSPPRTIPTIQTRAFPFCYTDYPDSSCGSRRPRAIRVLIRIAYLSLCAFTHDRPRYPCCMRYLPLLP